MNSKVCIVLCNFCFLLIKILLPLWNPFVIIRHNYSFYIENESNYRLAWSRKTDLYGGLLVNGVYKPPEPPWTFPFNGLGHGPGGSCELTHFQFISGSGQEIRNCSFGAPGSAVKRHGLV